MMVLTMCRTSASGCSFVIRICESFMPRTLFQLVLDIFIKKPALSSSRLPEGNNVNLVFRFCVHHGHCHFPEKPQIHESLLFLVDSVILDVPCRPSKNAFLIH